MWVEERGTTADIRGIQNKIITTEMKTVMIREWKSLEPFHNFQPMNKIIWNDFSYACKPNWHETRKLSAVNYEVNFWT